MFCLSTDFGNWVSHTFCHSLKNAQTPRTCPCYHFKLTCLFLLCTRPTPFFQLYNFKWPILGWNWNSKLSNYYNWLGTCSRVVMGSTQQWHRDHRLNHRGWAKSSQVHLRCKECIVHRKLWLALIVKSYESVKSAELDTKFYPSPQITLHCLSLSQLNSVPHKQTKESCPSYFSSSISSTIAVQQLLLGEMKLLRILFPSLSLSRWHFPLNKILCYLIGKPGFFLHVSLGSKKPSLCINDRINCGWVYKLQEWMDFTINFN